MMLRTWPPTRVIRPRAIVRLPPASQRDHAGVSRGGRFRHRFGLVLSGRRRPGRRRSIERRRRLGFDQHFLAADSLRAVAGVALSMTAAPTAGAAPEARWRRGASRRKGRDRWREITLRRAM